MAQLKVVRVGDEVTYYHDVSGKTPLVTVEDAVARAVDLQRRYPWIRYLVCEKGKPPFKMVKVNRWGYRNAIRQPA